MLRPEYPLLTPRLALRPFEPSDVDAVLAYASRPDVARYLVYSPRTRGQIVERLADAAKFTAVSAQGDGLNLAVIRRDTGRLIGDVVLEWTSEAHSRAAIRYVFHPDHHGHGFASEAARELIRLAFEDLAVHKVTARLDSRNTASARLLERIGMRAEARLVGHEWFKGEWNTVLDYGIVVDEWRCESGGA